jgi:NAD(P)-dependent dehydrogenase (short-subunit alcohol dehydrogenase family)
MQDFAGKTAFVTGAAQGIGLGISRALLRRGANVAMADIDGAAVEAAREKLDGPSIAMTLDVSDAAAVARAAGAVEARFGKVHLLCNNAGVVAPPQPVSAVPLEQWDWLVGVNLYGAIHGIAAFLPLIRKHGEGGHIVNTASIAGLQVRAGRGTGPYAATKFAVVALSESLAQELEGSGIGVSVLCPAAVDTKIYEAPRRRPARFGGPFAPPAPDEARRALADGMSPDEVGERVLHAIIFGELYILTHEETRDWLAERHGRIMAAFDQIARFDRGRRS